MTAQTGLAVSRDASNNGTLPKGFRLAIGGMLAKNGASGLDVRKGVLWDNGAPVVTGTANMSYDIRSHNAVVMPSSTQGPIIVPNDATVNKTTTAAPGSNSRIDVIWVRQHLVAADGGADSDVIGEYGVTQGTAAASPVAPSIPSGALELARATVTSGTTATNTLTISQTHAWTSAAGAAIPVRNDTERGALTAFDGLVVDNLAVDRLQRYDGTTWQTVGSEVRVGSATPTSPFATTLVLTRIGNVVQCDGGFSRATGSSTAFVAAGTIPAGFRPATDLTIPGFPFFNTALTWQPAVASATGVVTIRMSGSSNGSMFLSGLSWLTADA